jgi:NitT/TauT family transport system ATP-binding protein
MIEVSDVSISYGRGPDAVEAVRSVSFTLEAGRSLTLLGPSGCGKTTLLLAIAGLLPITHGALLVDDVPVAGPRREIALILQNAGLLPWKTVWQNANLSLRLGHEYPAKTAENVLRELRLLDVRDRFPAELSEGMKRRVGIARALSTAPSVMLMDEPLASLDTLTRERIQDLFLTLWQTHRFSLILVTHDIEEAAFLGQSIAVLSERPATVVDVVDNPAMGALDYRRTPAYRDTLVRLREGLER